MSVNVSYKLTGAGWAECSLNVDGTITILTASYLSHALENLLQGASDLLKGHSPAKFSFDEEPGEYRWLLTQINEQQIQIKILWFNELWGKEPDEDGTVIFEGKCRMRTFAGAVLSASKQVLAEYGLNGYKGKWEMHDFPITAQKELIQLLAHK